MVGTGFDKALNALKIGATVRRLGWPKGTYVKAQTPDKFSKMTCPYLYIIHDGRLIPWLPDTIDLLANDWCPISAEIMEADTGLGADTNFTTKEECGTTRRP